MDIVDLDTVETHKLSDARRFARADNSFPIILRLLLALLLTMLVAGAPDVAACSSSGEPVVGTDQADYPPIGTAIISGSGFGCGELLSVLVTAPDGSTRSGDGLGSPGPDSVTPDGNGAFTMNYQLSGTLPEGGTYFGQEGDYTASVIDASGTILAETTFSDGLGGFHSCIVTPSGGVKCWGFNDRGRLGDGTVINRATPVDVFGLSSGVIQISLGAHHTCAVTSGGGAKCWGFNLFGQVGDGSPQAAFSKIPVDVLGLTAGISQISAGTFHTCALTTAGGVKCWGENSQGQLGDGTTTMRLTPVDVIGLNSGVVQISAGMSHTCALLATGDVKCWGFNGSGGLGNGTKTSSLIAVDVTGLSAPAIQISAGGHYTCAVITGGGAKCWGANGNGNLGDGTGTNRTMPVDVIGLTSGVAQISAGFAYTCAVTTAGGVKCWGSQLISTVPFSHTPIDIDGLTSGVTQIRTGGSHTCALTTAGGVKCWGLNSQGQLGDGTIINRPAPVDVVGLTTGAAQLPDAVTTPNQAPTASAGGPYQGNEGLAVTLGSATASDADDDLLSYTWSVNSAICSFDDASLLTPSLSCADNGSFIATLTVNDGANPGVQSYATVMVENAAPSAGSITAPLAPVLVGAEISASAPFADPGILDTHAAIWDWGDTTQSAGTVTQANGSGSVDGSHIYTTPGVYTLRLTVTDKDGASVESVYEFIVVYDPNGGFVTGSGWIESPAGANSADPSITGRAHFGFVSKYKKGATVPTGNTMFSFKAGELTFHSVEYDWLLVTGSNYGMFKGSGTVNGGAAPNGALYKFQIWAGDETGSLGEDTFRIKIWYEDNGSEVVVYDNGMDQAIGGGNVQVHDN